MGRVVINDSSDTELFTSSNPGVVSGTVAATGGLTDAQLRATAVPVSGTVTASGVQTDALTDTELRASAVDVDIRQSTTTTANIPTGTALSGVVDKRGYAGGLVHMPAAWTAANVGFYVASAADGTFQPFYDQHGSLVQVVAAQGKSFDLPASMFAVRFFKFWSQNGSGVDVNQTREGGTTLSVDLGA